VRYLTARRFLNDDFAATDDAFLGKEPTATFSAARRAVVTVVSHAISGAMRACSEVVFAHFAPPSLDGVLGSCITLIICSSFSGVSAFSIWRGLMPISKPVPMKSAAHVAIFPSGASVEHPP
jgi:hypothetical protein